MLISPKNYLLELKLAGIKGLSRDFFLEFIGIRKSTDRIDYYSQIKQFLSDKACKYWDAHSELIYKGDDMINTVSK